MSEPPENYIPQNIVAKMRKQAVRAWAVGFAVVSIWVLLIVAAPVAKANGFTSFSSPLYHFFSFICHQLPQRSFHVAGEQFGVCSRCFGVYFGLVAGFVIYPLWRNIADIEPLSRFWLFASMIPIGIDWSLTVFGIWENNHFSRFVTGLILGVACATYIVPAIVEITRNMTWRRLSEPPA